MVRHTSKFIVLKYINICWQVVLQFFYIIVFYSIRLMVIIPVNHCMIIQLSHRPRTIDSITDWLLFMPL